MRGRLMARGALLLMLAAVVAWPAAAQSPESSEAAQAASNILVNGSFDGGLEGWETWTPRGNPEIRYDETVYRSAPGSIRVEGFAPNDRAALVQRPAVEAGKWYTISAWVKTENVSGDAVRLRVQFNLATDPTQKTREHLILGRLGGSRDWTLLQETFQVPPGTGTLIVEPFLDSGQGVVWWDDVSLIAVEEGAQASQ